MLRAHERLDNGRLRPLIHDDQDSWVGGGKAIVRVGDERDVDRLGNGLVAWHVHQPDIVEQRSVQCREHGEVVASVAPKVRFRQRAGGLTQG
jgi:hypothetical protein